MEAKAEILKMRLYEFKKLRKCMKHNKCRKQIKCRKNYQCDISKYISKEDLGLVVKNVEIAYENQRKYKNHVEN